MFLWQTNGIFQIQRNEFIHLNNSCEDVNIAYGVIWKDSLQQDSATIHYVFLEKGYDAYGRSVSVSGRIMLKLDGYEIESFWGQKVEINGLSLREGGYFAEANTLGVCGWSHPALHIRSRINKGICNTLNRRDESGLLSALLLGKVTNFAVVYKQKIRSCGASHLLALSGFHLGLLLQIAAFAAGARRRRLYIRIPMLVLVWFYHFVVGPVASLTRASMTLTLLTCFEGSAAPWKMRRALLASTVIMLTLYPALVSDIGFRLSVFALYGIILGTPSCTCLIKPFVPGKLAGIIGTSFAAQLATLGITAAVFNSVPVMAFLYIMVLTPLITVYAVSGIASIFFVQIAAVLRILRLCITGIFDLGSYNLFINIEGRTAVMVFIITGATLLIAHFKVIRTSYGYKL